MNRVLNRIYELLAEPLTHWHHVSIADTSLPGLIGTHVCQGVYGIRATLFVTAFRAALLSLWIGARIGLRSI